MSATTSQPLAAQLDPTTQNATDETKHTDRGLDRRDPVTTMLSIVSIQ